MKKSLRIVLAFILFFLCGKPQAQNPADLDTSFNIGSGFSASGSVKINSIALQPDDKILIGGDFISYNGITQNRIVRLNQDGSIDTSFDIGTGFNNEVLVIEIQPDGKILVGGWFTSYNGQTQNKILRLNTDGTLDTSFTSETFGYVLDGFSGEPRVLTIAVQPDGKILVGGEFTSYDGQNLNRIIRLNTDGTLDNSFNIGTGFIGIEFHSVKTIVLQPDGKILVGGDFSYYNGQTLRRIARLNVDGTRDTSFTIGSGFIGVVSLVGSVQTIVLQPDGKILVGGIFASYNGQACRAMVRLNTSGTLDTSFTLGTQFNGNGHAIAIQPDGKILVGGTFTSYNGQSQNRIARLDTDGSLDATFNVGTGFNSYVRTIALQPDGKILVGGNFSEYKGQTVNKIVRLHNDEELSVKDLGNAGGIMAFPNPVKDWLYLDKEVKKITLRDLTGKVLAVQNNSNQVDMSALQNGVYLVTIETENNMIETKKIVKSF